MSNWGEHPGGSLLFSHAGHDATGAFGGFHPASAYDALVPFYIGVLDSKVTALEEDFRALRNTVKIMGLHKARCGGLGEEEEGRQGRAVVIPLCAPVSGALCRVLAAACRRSLARYTRAAVFCVGCAWGRTLFVAEAVWGACGSSTCGEMW